MRKNPYRGIYTQIAREENLARSTVKEAIEVFKNPRLCQRFAELVRERRAAVEDYERLARGESA